MSNAVIEVDHLSKLYELGTIGTRTLQESLQRRWYHVRGKEHLLHKIGAKHQTMPPDHPQAGPRPNTMWALKDASFTVKEGEVLGIIGRNGAGKSTLLKLLTRITEPTSGRALVYGRVASLLEVGTGFHPELTGRENVYLNGAILGMKRTEIARKFDEIVAFSEVEQFIDTPVKRYSSGMYVRLAFAVAAHLDPEILLVDEVLAVGDAAFQRKCLGKMGDVAKGGRTVLFVSHNMAAVQNLCGRALLISEGRVLLEGPSDSVISRYIDAAAAAATTPLNQREDRQGNGRVRVTGVEMRGGSQSTNGLVRMGDDLVAEITYVAADGYPLRNARFSLHVLAMSGQPIVDLCNDLVGDTFDELPSSGRVRCSVPHWPLLPGRYTFNVCLQLGTELADWVLNAGVIEVGDGDFYKSGRSAPNPRDLLVLSHRWEASRPELRSSRADSRGATEP